MLPLVAECFLVIIAYELLQQVCDDGCENGMAFAFGATFHVVVLEPIGLREAALDHEITNAVFDAVGEVVDDMFRRGKFWIGHRRGSRNAASRLPDGNR
jgi:hypothetical protein